MLIKLAGGAAYSEIHRHLCIHFSGTKLLSSEVSGTSVNLERLPFFLFFPFFLREASYSLLSKCKHPKLFADANSRSPVELCLMSLPYEVCCFLLGTFRCSAATFLLPRKDPNKLACSYLMVIPFAAPFLSRWHHYILNG